MKAMSMTRLILATLLLGAAVPAFAQTSTPPASGSAGQSRPSRGPDQQSVGTAPGPAQPGQTTGSTEQGPVVQQMNEAERKKVEQQGK